MLAGIEELEPAHLGRQPKQFFLRKHVCGFVYVKSRFMRFFPNVQGAKVFHIILPSPRPVMIYETVFSGLLLTSLPAYR
jgi:hypothetical protein